MSTLSLRKIKHDSSTVDNITLNSNGTTSTGAELVVPSLKGVSGNKLQLRSGDSSFGVSLQNVSGIDLLTVDAVGRVTKPYQPSFFAMANGGTSYSANTTIVFPTIQHNTGSHYNASTGRFTAPVSGRYFFYTQMLGDASGNRTIAHVAINGTTGSTGQNVEISAYTGTYNSAQGTIIFNLVAGDYVSIKTTDQNAWYGSATFQNFFCGYLIG